MAFAGDIIYESQAGYLSGVIEHWRRNHCKHQQTLQVSLKSAAAHEWSAALFHTQKLQRAFHHFLLRETTIARHGNRLAVEFVSNWLTKSKSAKGCPACDPHLGRDYPQPVCKQEKIVIESDRGEKFSGKVSKTCENVVSLGRGKLVGTFAPVGSVSFCVHTAHSSSLGAHILWRCSYSKLVFIVFIATWMLW